MENSLQEYYINAIDSILNERQMLSKVEYGYVYSLVYSKYKGLKNAAIAIEKAVSLKMAKHVNIEELFNSNVFSEQEKQSIITYWTSSYFANSANKGNISKKTYFLTVVRNDYNKVRAIFASKQFVDENGVVYNGSEIFGKIEVKDELNESLAVIGKIALSMAVWLGLDALSPTIAKKVPEICSLVRNCAEKYPTVTKIANYTISPFDIDAFIEQDKINKGESVEGEEENYDDYDVVMDDGSVYDTEEDNTVLNTNSEDIGKVYNGTFTDADGTVYNFTFKDKDKK